MKSLLLLTAFFFTGLYAAQAQACQPNPACIPNPKCCVSTAKAGPEKDAATTTSATGQFFTVPVSNSTTQPAKATNCAPADCKIKNCDPSKCVPVGCEKTTVGKKA